MKKLISLAMSLIMTFTAVAPSITTHAEEQPTTAQTPYVDNNITVSGTNSFGNMLSKVLTEEQTEVEENNGFNVFSIDIEGKTATAEYEAQEDCTLVAAIYDEDGNALLATGSVDVVAGETSTTFEIDTETMPQYFYLRGFLIDPDTLRPKCTVYESPMYTQEMQEFLAKTTDDFDENLVLSLDGSKDNNFAVFAEGTKQIKTSETVNTFVTWDEATDTYTFANADSSLSWSAF